MFIMLIVDVLLILGVARLVSTSENSVITTTAKSKRDLTTLQAITTVHTIPYHNSPSTLNYTPYREANIPSTRGEIVRQTKTPQFHLQGGFHATQTQNLGNRVAQNVYNSPSPLATNQFPTKVLIGGTDNPPYYGSPSSYRIPEIGKLSGSFSGSSVFPSFPKFKSSATTLSSSAYPDHSFESPKYHFNPATKFNPRASSLVDSQRSNVPVYEGTSRPVTKNLGVTSGSFSSDFASLPSVKPYEKFSHNYGPYNRPSSVDYPASKALPVSLKLQNNRDITGHVKSFENEPVILNTGHDYQTQASSGQSFDFPNTFSTPGTRSFSSNVVHHQPRTLPVHSARTTTQIPQYKGAAVNEFSESRQNDRSNGYERIADQPQFHFTGGRPSQSLGTHQPIIYHSKPFEQSKTDVELINKKRTTTQRPYDSEEIDYDRDFKTAAGNFGYSTDESDENSRPTTIPTRDSNYKLPRSNLFNTYDQAFGKYSKLASTELDNTGKRGGASKNDETSKPVYQSVEEEDDDGESADDDKKSSGDYRSSYVEENEPNSSYENEDEEESQKSERQRSVDDENEDDDDDNERASYRSYGEDFEKEFEESYAREPPKSDYVHVKEVPEIEESRSESKSYPGRKTSRVGSKEKTRHVVRGDNEQPKNYETYRSREYEGPKFNSRDNEGHGSGTSYKRTKITEPRTDDKYGYKITRDRGNAKSAKSKDSKRTITDVEPTREASNDREPQGYSENSSRSFSTTKRPLTSTISSIVQSYTFPPFGSWKPSEKLTRDRESYVASTRRGAQAIFNPENSAHRSSQIDRQNSPFFANGQSVRDLTGI